MLGSVVNTLEQRGEWLNGGRGAATAMIDRRSANGVTPFEAAEHLEFFGAGDDLGVCANGFLQGEERLGGSPPSARMAKGLAFEDMRVCGSGLERLEGRGGGVEKSLRVQLRIQGPGNRHHCPGCWSRASSAASP